jgi:putative nucleotidyltransferase with HDIG domain
MPDQVSNISNVSRQVELAIARLESLSILPCVGAQVFSRLLESQFSPAVLADIIESDPALTARILRLADREGVVISEGRFSVRRALDRLSAHVVRDALLSVRVSAASVSDDGPGGAESLLEKELLLHSLAVACCAREISAVTAPQTDPQLAYCAGLLHDIGKLALREAMPKSFVRIAEEAESSGSCSCAVEAKHLGVDHAILGKRLCQKWHLPNQIGLAVWLHHSDTTAICGGMPEASLAQLVQLADLTARQCGIGRSGSYDSPDSVGEIARSVGISGEQLEMLRRNLAAQVAEKAHVLGLDLPDSAVGYCETVHTAAGRWARENTELSLENRRLQTVASDLDFTTDFLLATSSTAGPISAAEDFAVRWQRFYQTGTVCLYLAPSAGSQNVEAVVVEKLGQSKPVSLAAPPGAGAAIPAEIANRFAILDAHAHLDWMFEQLDVAFDFDRTRLLPLLSNDRAVGAIAFELHYPGDAELFEEKFRRSASIAGVVLDMAFAWDSQQRAAERFVGIISRPTERRPSEVRRTEPGVETQGLADALAELTAGAAHELNNPLSVISGRAQLLAEAEDDREKKEILKQIHENAGEASAIIEDLMSFAEPPQPRPTRTDIRQMLEEAVQLTGRKTDAEHINMQIQVAPDATEVYVDSAQMVSAIANIVTNAVESYRGELGPVKITAEPAEPGGRVRLTISDLGCGMDAETLRKATQPFFSARPAGRKRGMGLAYAARFVQVNRGLLKLESKPGSGTTVTILLPGK